jgi:hypothetical protein
LMYSLRLYNRKISFRRRPRRPAGLVPEASPAEGQGGDTDSTRNSHQLTMHNEQWTRKFLRNFFKLKGREVSLRAPFNKIIFYYFNRI